MPASILPSRGQVLHPSLGPGPSQRRSSLTQTPTSSAFPAAQLRLDASPHAAAAMMQQQQAPPPPPPAPQHPPPQAGGGGEFYRGPPQPPMRQLSAASSTNLPSDYAAHPAPPSHQHQPPYEAYGDSFGAKRMRKPVQRRTVDYTSTVVRYVQHDARDRVTLQPTPAAVLDIDVPLEVVHLIDDYWTHVKKEAFDPPTSVVRTTLEIENVTSNCMSNNIRDDEVVEQDSISLCRPCLCPGDILKRKEDTHFLSHANRAVSHQEYQARSSCSNYAESLESHTYSKEARSLGSEYCKQQPNFSSSSCSLENSSSAIETVPSSPDASGNLVGKMTTRSKISGLRPDYLASCPTIGSHMRRSYPAAAKVDFSLDCHSEHQHKRSDRFAAFLNCNGQSIERCNETVDLPRGAHFLDETTLSSSQWCFDNEELPLPRGLEYGDEIPSLSSQKCYGNEALALSSRQGYGAEIPSLSSRQGYGAEIPSLSRRQGYGAEIPSLLSRQGYGAEIPSLSSRQGYSAEIPSLSSRQGYGAEIPSHSRRQGSSAEIPSLSSRQGYGDEIPSLSGHWGYQDKVHTGRWCHGAGAHSWRINQQGASHGYGHSRENVVSSPVSNQHVRMITSKHTVTRPTAPNRVVNNTDHCRINKKDNPSRNSEDIQDQVRGPRADKLNNASIPSTGKDVVSPLVHRNQINRSDFSVQYEHAKFFMIKSYSEDDIHKGVKYNVWASTPNGNNKLDAAFHEAQKLMKEKGTKCHVFLFFSVNTSGQFVGLAEMLGPVDFKKTMDFWQQDKWNGFFPVMWHILKDIPNRLFKHITLENNNDRPVTFSRDTQEIGLPQGLEMLKIFKAYCHKTSILDDFKFYEEKENACCARKGTNADSHHEARLSFFGTEARDSDNFESMDNLETSMESMSFYENWD